MNLYAARLSGFARVNMTVRVLADGEEQARDALTSCGWDEVLAVEVRDNAETLHIDELEEVSNG